MHTFSTILEAETLDGLSNESRAIDHAALTAIAFHEPKRLKEERARLQRRVRVLADRNGARRKAALVEGSQLIERVEGFIGGPK